MADIFTHNQYLNQFMTYIRSGQEKYQAASYAPGRTAVICPEPLTFLSQMDRFASDKDQCRAMFEDMVLQCDANKGFRTVDMSKNAMGLWFNTTAKGINLRPGINSANGKPSPVELGDSAVHGLMAGQTGSGKSTLLNNLIFNLMTEYAPWELDLYLADFKKVEFSRYMNNPGYRTPHVVACAATSEVRYVVSLIEYLVDCMTARETFFARIGTDKIANFRKQYPDVVLPRILLIVDEFQQLFLEASNKESEKIRQMMTAIVKKGRATGVHILFASQEISGTLSRSDLGNFRLRIALNCETNVSMDVLGNRAAAYIKPKKDVLINNSDGKEDTNLKYQVPYVETELNDDWSGKVPYFNTFLSDMSHLADQFSFRKAQKFYQEDEQQEWEVLENILDKITPFRQGLLTPEMKNKYFEALTLGSYVTFSNRKFDYQTLFLENGRKKNILAVSPRNEDLAYLQKLLAQNFITSPKNEAGQIPYVHKVYSFLPVVQGLYAIEKDLLPKEFHTNPDDFAELKQEFRRISVMYRIYEESQTVMDFVKADIRANRKSIRGRSQAEVDENIEKLILLCEETFGNVQLFEAEAFCADIEKRSSNFGDDSSEEKFIKYIAADLVLFAKFKQNPELVFPPTVYWISGAEALERMPEWLFTMMKTGLDYNILFVIMASSEFDQMNQTVKYCDYIFAGGMNRRIYDRLGVNYTNKSPDSIALDLQVRSMEEERSFKKFRCGFEKLQRPEIPFELYL